MTSVLYKYPRTYHLPFSPGVSNDDKVLNNIDCFKNKEIVITEKMDGENTTIYNDYYHARSINSKHENYHSYLLGNILPIIQPIIPNNYRICGEYLYAKHSIEYNNLLSYFLVFSIWNDKNICLSWNDTINFCNTNNLYTVPELWRGIFDENKILEIANSIVNNGGEGIVIRDTNEFSYSDFSTHIAKYVRSNHVQTDIHWSKNIISKNKLKERCV